MLFFNGKLLTVAVAAALSGAATVPSSTPQTSPAPQPAATEVKTLEIPALPAMPQVAPTPAPAPAAAPLPRMAPIVEEGDLPQAQRRTASTEVDSELECLAKVVLHEAGNQGRVGMTAVAEVVMNRLNDPRRRFGRTICGVVMQRGQFFNVHAYNGRRDPRWSRAVEIARQVRAGEAEKVTNGAYFFRAHYGAGFPGRTRVATIGGHAFYR